MRVKIGEHQYGISFKHEVPPPSSVAERIARAAIGVMFGQEEVSKKDYLLVGEKIQGELDRTIRQNKWWASRSTQRRRGRVTTCTIYKWGEGKEFTIIGVGRAECSLRDVFIKEKGRVESLKKALDYAFPDDSDSRREFYAQYHAR